MNPDACKTKPKGGLIRAAEIYNGRQGCTSVASESIGKSCALGAVQLRQDSSNFILGIVVVFIYTELSFSKAFRKDRLFKVLSAVSFCSPPGVYSASSVKTTVAKKTFITGLHVLCHIANVQLYFDLSVCGPRSFPRLYNTQSCAVRGSNLTLCVL